MSQEDRSLVSGGRPRKSAKTEPAPTHNPDPLYCSYYVLRKNRFCRTECRPGSLYCCTHDVAPVSAASAAASEADQKNKGNGDVFHPSSDPSGEKIEGGEEVKNSKSSGETRVPCPINPNHTVYASRLVKHVKVCPDLRFVTAQLSYFSENRHANQGAVFVGGGAASTNGKESDRGSSSNGSGGKRRTHRDLSAEELAALVVKVETCYRNSVEGELVVLPSSTLAASTTSPTRKAAADSCSTTGAAPTSAPSLSSPTPHTSHAESASQKHGPQHTALLRCLSDVVLQSTSDDSILTHYARLPFMKGKTLCTTNTAVPGPIHVDGFLEFGAGKGGLSVALQQLIVQQLPATPTQKKESAEIVNDTASPTEEAETSATTLVATASWPFLKEVAVRPPLVVLDMDGFRRKGDARVRHSTVPLQRLRINIKDVNLTQAFLTDIRPVKADTTHTQDEGSERAVESWAVLGKHLCGACTDFALSCLAEAPTLAQEAQVRLPIVVIATCCHHRCELVHLNPPQTPTRGGAEGLSREGSAPSVLQMPGSELTWSPEEVAALTSMSSWAVCGGFVDEARRVVGWRCKRILDQMRVHFLRRMGYVAFQCQYTTRDVTEENVCLVAFQPPA